jgi:hypothetical protein
MEYKLYTLVDITNTGQYRTDPGKEKLRYKEQNFQTVLLTLGIRANISYRIPPELLEVKGSVVGLPTDSVVRVWRFDFYTEQDNLYGVHGDPVGYLKEDFEAVPYISNLDECMEQTYNVFVTAGPAQNIVFFKK